MTQQDGLTLEYLLDVVIEPARAGAPGRLTATAPDGWRNGRTLFGGLGSSIAVLAMRRLLGIQMPLRHLQVAFIGPLEEQLSVSTTLLRQGRNVTFVQASLSSGAGPALLATACFGAGRPSSVSLEGPVAEAGVLPEDLPEGMTLPGDGAPAFVRQVDFRFFGSALPFSGAASGDFSAWLRFRDPRLHDGEGSFLALADGLPPPICAMARQPGPMSSLTWTLDMTTEDLTTTDGWWLVRSTAEQAQDGYSTQTMSYWNREGRLVARARQSVAVFL